MVDKTLYRKREIQQYEPRDDPMINSGSSECLSPATLTFYEHFRYTINIRPKEETWKYLLSKGANQIQNQYHYKTSTSETPSKTHEFTPRFIMQL